MAFRHLRAIAWRVLASCSTASPNMLLVVDQISAGYGSLEVIQSIEMRVAEGECVSLIGWSGTGKTTLLKTIAGLIHPFSGNISFNGESIVALPAHRRVQKGI